MDPRPLVGITTQNLHALDAIPAHLPPSWLMSARFVLAPVESGALPCLIPLLEDEDTLRGIYERLDGLLLPGGADIDPASYGAVRSARCETSDPPRDRVEGRLVRWAMEDGLPVLGLCRGLQIVNLARGGTLHQDLEEERPGEVKHDWFPSQGYARDRLSHPVQVAEDSRLAGIWGTAEAEVNSMHHQGVRTLGDGLRAVAWAPDGLVEAVELPDHPFLIGVQWHSEELTPALPRSRRLFDAFVEAARAHHLRKAAPVRAL